MTFTVRRLKAADAAAYRDIRLEALTNEPTAFASDPSLEDGKALEEWAAQLERNFSFGVFGDDELVGIASYLTDARQKTRHRGTVVAVYVRPKARGKGASRALFGTLIEDASGRVQQLHLSVTAGNAAAKRLYEALGFAVYGTEPRALYVEGRYHDEYLMVLRLDEGSRKVTSDE